MSFAVLKETAQRTDTFGFQIAMFANTQGPDAYKLLLCGESWNLSTFAGFQIGALYVSLRKTVRGM